MKIYELAYACRLYRELASSDEGFDATYTKVREALRPNADLSSHEQRCALMEFLNQWLCRIPRTNFPSLKRKLQTWAAKYIPGLPATGRGIHSLTTEERTRIGDAYDALLALGQGLHFQDTAAAKTLHVLRPDALPIWDSKIKTDFRRKQPKIRESSRLYSAFIDKVANEISEIKQDAKRLSRDNILHVVERESGSLVKLVDEYNYVTITLGHVIPTPDKFENWLNWSR